MRCDLRWAGTALAAAVLTLGIAAAPAEAIPVPPTATLTLTHGVLTYTAGVRQVNDVDVGIFCDFQQCYGWGVSSSVAMVVDSDCDEVGGPTSALCPSFTTLVINLGDGADSARVTFQDFGPTLTHVVKVYGGTGADELTDNTPGLVPDGSTLLSGGDGNDILTAGVAYPTTLLGGAGDDTLTGRTVSFKHTPGSADLLDGGPGADTIHGGTEPETLRGNTGSDAIAGGGGTDIADYSDHANAVQADIDFAVRDDGGVEDGPVGARDNLGLDIEGLRGSPAGDRLGCLNKSCRLDGGAGTDTLLGGSQNDTLLGGSGPDVLSGGGGIDTADYSDHTSGVTVDLDGVNDDGNAVDGPVGVRDHLTGIENLVGTAKADSLTGDSHNNRINSYGGADRLSGLGGNDTLLGGTGADRFYGGTGQDLVSYSDHTLVSAPVSADTDGHSGDDGGSIDGLSGARDTIGIDVENLQGGAGDDALSGFGAVGANPANHLWGGAGDDTLHGLGGDDFLYGEAGDDTLIGGGGNDTDNGGAGTDTCSSGSPIDCEVIIP